MNQTHCDQCLAYTEHLHEVCMWNINSGYMLICSDCNASRYQRLTEAMKDIHPLTGIGSEKMKVLSQVFDKYRI